MITPRRLNKNTAKVCILCEIHALEQDVKDSRLGAKTRYHASLAIRAKRERLLLASNVRYLNPCKTHHDEILETRRNDRAADRKTIAESSARVRSAYADYKEQEKFYNECLVNYGASDSRTQTAIRHLTRLKNIWAQRKRRLWELIANAVSLKH